MAFVIYGVHIAARIHDLISNAPSVYGCRECICFMKLILYTILAISLIGPAALIAQRSQVEPRSNLIEAEPFQIRTGTSFTASAPGTPIGTRSRGSAAERNRILDDLREAEALIKDKYIDGKKIQPAAMTKAALGSMLHTLDPHSNFFDRDEWKELLDEQQSGYAGIGTSFAGFNRNGEPGTYILSTFAGTAARRAGLKYGDRIVTVNGQAVAARSADEVRDMIRGTLGTTVTIDVERAATGQTETVELRRGIVAQPSIPDFYMLQAGVGYIDLSEGFNYTTTDEFTAALNDLHRQGMTSLILDLRGNGGGIVDQAVKVAEKFLPSGSLIVSQRGRSVADSREWVSANPSPETMPLVIVVDEHTASASEIVTGALQDSDRAIVVGQKTFGKGLVQNVIDLPYKNGLTLTAARYYTPTGRSIQRDYSEIGRYDYFNHREPDSGIDRPYFEARTITNRRVLGGDGIAPDEVSVPVAVTSAEAALRDSLFLFTRDLVNGRIAGTDASTIVPRGTIDAFIRYSAANTNSHIDGRLIRAEQDYVLQQIRYQIAIALKGSVQARRVLNMSEPQILAAVQSLPRAGELAARANKMRLAAK